MDAGATGKTRHSKRVLAPAVPAEARRDLAVLLTALDRNRHSLPARVKLWARFLSQLPELGFHPRPVRGGSRIVFSSRYWVVKLSDFSHPGFRSASPDFIYQPFWCEAMLYYWAQERGLRIFPYTLFLLDGPYPIQIQERAQPAVSWRLANQLLKRARTLPGGAGLTDLAKSDSTEWNVGYSVWDGRPVIFDWDFIMARFPSGARLAIWFKREPRRFTRCLRWQQAAAALLPELAKQLQALPDSQAGAAQGASERDRSS